MNDSRFLVMGAGMMGRAIAYDIVKFKGSESILLADSSQESLDEIRDWLGGGIETCLVNVNDLSSVKAILSGVKMLVCALPYRFNLDLMKLAIGGGCHFCDLGGNDRIVSQQLVLNDGAKDAGVLCLPDCGLAPGMANVLAMHLTEGFDSVDRLTIRVGGLPQHPKPPLSYQLAFSVGGLINEYIEDCKVLRDGKITTIKPMTGLENLVFKGMEKMEAFHTSGGAGWLPVLLEGKVRELDYKTIRYPGHCERFKTMLDLGLAGDNVVSDDLTMRGVFESQLVKALSGDDEDLVLVRIMADGKRGGERFNRRLEIRDFYDGETNITAMMRTTSFPTSIIAQMVVDGTVKQRGVMTPESCVPGEPFIRELAERGIFVREG
jgi:lysine 6-dehydrogenase